MNKIEVEISVRPDYFDILTKMFNNEDNVTLKLIRDTDHTNFIRCTGMNSDTKKAVAADIKS